MDTLSKAALPRDLKTHNYREVLRSIGAEKQFTIAHITNGIDISRQTITKAIEYFLQKEVIMPGRKGESTEVGGRKSQEYMLNKEKYIIAVSLHSRKVWFALLNFAYELIDSINLIPAAWQSYETFLETVKVCTEKLLQRNRISHKNFYGIMVCTGGIIDSKKGVIKVSSIYSGWRKNIPIKEDIQKLFESKIQVCVDNVASTSASVLLMDKDAVGKRIAVLYLDYGVGVTFLEDGRIPKTRHNVNGELGHMVIQADSEKVCDCGDRGCLEALIYEKNIRLMAEELPEERRTRLFEGYDVKDDFRVFILKKCDEGNQDAAVIADYLAGVLGTAMRNIIFAFDPDEFVLMGTFSDWSEGFKEKVLGMVRKNEYLSDLDLPIRQLSKNTEELMNKGSVSIMLQSFLDYDD